MVDRQYKKGSPSSKFEKLNSMSFQVEEGDKLKNAKDILYLKKLQISPNSKTTTKLKRFTFTQKFVPSLNQSLFEKILQNSPIKRHNNSNANQFLIHNQSAKILKKQKKVKANENENLRLKSLILTEWKPGQSPLKKCLNQQRKKDRIFINKLERSRAMSPAESEIISSLSSPSKRIAYKNSKNLINPVPCKQIIELSPSEIIQMNKDNVINSKILDDNDLYDSGPMVPVSIIGSPKYSSSELKLKSNLLPNKKESILNWKEKNNFQYNQILQKMLTNEKNKYSNSIQTYQVSPSEKEKYFEYIKNSNARQLEKAIILEPNFLNEKDSLGMTGVHWAVKRNKIEILRILLKGGANINSKDIILRTPLHIAVREGHKEIVYELLTRGADPYDSEIPLENICPNLEVYNIIIKAKEYLEQYKSLSLEERRSAIKSDPTLSSIF